MDRRVVLHLLFIPLSVLLLSGVAWGVDGPAGLAAVLATAVLVSLSSLILVSTVRRSEREMCALDEQLIQSQKLASIGELSSGLAHEINNPIAIIGQETEWIGQLLSDPPFNDTPGTADILDSLREIRHQVERCRDITHKLLTLARKWEPVIQETDVSRLVEDMVVLVEREAKDRNIVMTRRYRPDLPKVATDPPLLRQVVLNLLTNATYAVGRDGEITVTTSTHDGQIEISVLDTGPGIAPADLKKVFDPFFTTKPPGQGTGLGLAISYTIMTRLGGRIEARSEPGQGAEFLLRLPVACSGRN